MIIDSNLRIALAAFCRTQKGEPHINRYQRAKAAVEELAKNPRHAARIKAAIKKRIAAYKTVEEADAVLLSLGISRDVERIDDEEKFKAAGGKMPEAPLPVIKVDELITRLMKVDDAAGKKILAELGIKWA